MMDTKANIPSLPSFAILAVKPRRIGVDRVEFDDRSDSTKTPLLITDIEKREKASCFCGSSEYYTARVVSFTAFAERVRGLNIADVMIYLHGYSSRPDSVFSGWKGKMDLQRSYGNDTLVVPVVWPCLPSKNELIIEGVSYLCDKWRLKMASEALRNFVSDLDKCCAKEAPVRDTLNFRTHLYTHSMGSSVMVSMAEKLKKKFFKKQSFKFGVVSMVQSNVTADLLKKKSKPFKKQGSKVAQLGKMVIVTYTAKDEALRFTAEQKKATKPFGDQDLGRVGPGDVSHLNNIRLYDASILLPGREKSQYHAFNNDSRFIAVMKNEFRMVRASSCR